MACSTCGAPTGDGSRCSYCGATAADTTRVAWTDPSMTLHGLLRGSSKAIRVSTGDGPGFDVSSNPELGPATAPIVGTEAVLRDVRVRASVVLYPPRSEISLTLRRTKSARYEFRVANDGAIGLLAMVHQPMDPAPQFSWLASSTIGDFAARDRSRPTTIVAAAIGSKLTMHVDGRLLIATEDWKTSSGRATVSLTVVPNDPARVRVTEVEVTVPAS